MARQPKRFSNLAPNDPIGVAKLVGIDKITSQKMSGRFNYIVGETHVGVGPR